MAVRMTRAELHRLVWESPMTKLAKQFSLSDVALHKICRKHTIPTPPQGHWAKKQHGKPVTDAPLPTGDAAGAADDVILIYEGAASAETDAMSNARARALERITEQPVVDCKPSALIERTLAKLERGKIDRFGLANTGSGLIAVSIRPASVSRARLVLERLHSAAVAAGMTLEVRDGKAVWDTDGEAVSFELRELADRYEHVATESELRALAKWEEKRAETHRRYGYLSDYGRPHIPKWEDRYQGRLGIRLEEVRVQKDQSWWGDVIARSFSDTKTRDLLNAVPKIVSTIAAIAVAKGENRNVEARRRAAEAEAQRRRAESQRQAAPEKDRGDFFAKLLDERIGLERLESYLAVLVQPEEGLPHLQRYRLWLSERLDRLRSRVTAAELEDRLVASELFVEPA